MTPLPLHTFEQALNQTDLDFAFVTVSGSRLYGFPSADSDFCYRVLMTGCVLLQEGVVEANLQALNTWFGYPFLEELVRIKAEGERVGLPSDGDYVRELERLAAELDRAYTESKLPEEPSVWSDLDALVVAARQKGPMLSEHSGAPSVSLPQPPCPSVSKRN